MEGKLSKENIISKLDTLVSGNMRFRRMQTEETF